MQLTPVQTSTNTLAKHLVNISTALLERKPFSQMSYIPLDEFGISIIDQFGKLERKSISNNFDPLKSFVDYTAKVVEKLKTNNGSNPVSNIHDEFLSISDTAVAKAFELELKKAGNIAKKEKDLDLINLVSNMKTIFGIN